MFDLPKTDVDDIPTFADWVELCSVFADTPEISDTDVADIVHDAGIVGTSPAELPPGDVSYFDDSAETPDDAIEHFTELIWKELQHRVDILEDASPFLLSGNTITRKAGSWSDIPAFPLLLVADASRAYPGIGVSTEPTSG